LRDKFSLVVEKFDRFDITALKDMFSSERDELNDRDRFSSVGGNIQFLKVKT
jgi:hypothetical protein